MPDIKFADLHLHTYYSDGTFSPKELLERSQAAGLSCIAITDHDTVDGLGEAFSLKPEEIELIAGIELSCDLDNREVHILGYFIDYKNDELLDKLNKIKEYRIERIYLMVDKLKEMKVDISAGEVLELSKLGTVGRLHIARVLLEKEIISNIREAFIKFIGEDCPAYVANFRLSVKEAIQTIIKFGGVAVLAHPYTLANDDMISKFADFGLKGIEVYYPEHTRFQVLHYKTLADSLGLVCTGGSDCHGQLKENIKVGSVRIPYEIVDKLKKAKYELKP
ncbi:MAG: PHP domain-containing protein [Candidatus Omnitrophota bacterium]